jgi:hypothetical protein
VLVGLALEVARQLLNRVVGVKANVAARKNTTKITRLVYEALSDGKFDKSIEEKLYKKGVELDLFDYVKVSFKGGPTTSLREEDVKIFVQKCIKRYDEGGDKAIFSLAENDTEIAQIVLRTVLKLVLSMSGEELSRYSKLKDLVEVACNEINVSFNLLLSDPLTLFKNLPETYMIDDPVVPTLALLNWHLIPIGVGFLSILVGKRNSIVRNFSDFGLWIARKWRSHMVVRHSGNRNLQSQALCPSERGDEPGGGVLNQPIHPDDL